MRFKFFNLLLLIGAFTFNLNAQPYNDSIDVLHYDINLRIDLKHQFVSGFTQIILTAKHPTDKINFGLWGLMIDSVFVNGQKQDSVWIQTQSFALPVPLKPQDTVRLTVFYHGNPLPDPKWGGFHFSEIDAYNYGIGMGSDPVSLGRVWFPANDIFTDKASFDFKITVDTGLIAVCNGKLLAIDTVFFTQKLKTQIIDPQTKQPRDFDTVLTKPLLRYHWRLEQPIPTYLANVGVSKYKHKSWIYRGLERDIPVDIYFLPTMPDSVVKSFRNLHETLRLFEKLFGAYPWNRVGYLQTTASAGAMEHVTNISLPRTAVNGTIQKQDLIFHELSHSWFGDLVTCKTLQDVWLHEGFASYFEGLWREFYSGEKAFKDWRREQHLLAINFAHKVDGGYKAIGKIDHDHAYGSTVYDKGADVVHTLRYQLGDSVFWQALRLYLKEYAYKNVSISEFREFLEKVTGQNLMPFFDYWIYSAGYPFFEVYYFSVQKLKPGKYQVALTIRQRAVGSDTLAYGQKLELLLLGKKNQILQHTLTVNGQWTYDTLITTFKPVVIIADPWEHVADATTDQLLWVKDAGWYYYDYELAEVYVEQSVRKPVMLRIQANWLKPDGKFPDGYLVQSNYYWTVQSNASKPLKGEMHLYLSKLMDPNFTHITHQDVPRLRIFYRANSYSPWQLIEAKPTEQGDAMIIKPIRPGQYALALQRY